MAVTTQTEPRRAGLAFGTIALAVTVGAILIAAGTSRLWMVLEAEPARVGFENIAKVPDASVDPALAHSIAKSLAAGGRLAPFIVPWASGDRGGSLEALMRERAGEATTAQATLTVALAHAPGDPHGWARLARLRLTSGDRVGAGAALRLSLLSGAVVPGLMQPRLRLGLDLYEELDADTQRLLLSQVRFVWMLAPLEIPRLLTQPANRPILLSALAEVGEADVQQFRRVNRLDPPPSQTP